MIKVWIFTDSTDDKSLREKRRQTTCALDTSSNISASSCSSTETSEVNLNRSKINCTEEPTWKVNNMSWHKLRSDVRGNRYFVGPSRNLRQKLASSDKNTVLNFYSFNQLGLRTLPRWVTEWGTFFPPACLPTEECAHLSYEHFCHPFCAFRWSPFYFFLFPGGLANCLFAAGQTLRPHHLELIDTAHYC